MIHIFKCFVGFIFLLIQLEEKFIITEVIGVCDVQPNNMGRLVANCSDKGIEKIPQNLGSSIKILDISNNTDLRIHSGDLKNYRNLFGFVMRYHAFSHFPEHFFTPVKHLEMMNITKSVMDAYGTLRRIPATLRVFNCSYCDALYDYNYMDISHLTSIEIVDLKGCENLEEFPSISSDAPLRYIDMRYCSLAKLSYTSLAPFCQLHYFGLFSQLLSASHNVLRCCGVQKWAKLKKIKGTNSMSCFTNQTHRSCAAYNVTINQDSLDQYSACVARLDHKWFLIYLKVFVTLIVGLIFIAAFGIFLFYVYYKHKIATRNSPTVASESISEPTVEPTVESTVEPTVESTVEPTVEVTVEPTVEPTKYSEYSEYNEETNDEG